MSFQEIAEYGKRFHKHGDRKITLNFIVMKNYPIDPKVIKSFFNSDIFIIKLTPLNPTKKAEKNKLKTKLDPYNGGSVFNLIKQFRSLGFEVIVSIGELDENKIGSNCGQYISATVDETAIFKNSY